MRSSPSRPAVATCDRQETAGSEESSCLAEGRGFELSPITFGADLARIRLAPEIRSNSNFRAAFPQVSKPGGVRI